MTTVLRTKWFMPTFAVGLGVLFLVVFWVGGDVKSAASRVVPKGTAASGIVLEASTVLVGRPAPSVGSTCTTQSPGELVLLTRISPRTAPPVVRAVKVCPSRRSPGLVT